MQNDSYRLGDLLKRKTQKTEIQPDEEYKLVTIKLHHKGVVLREVKKGSEMKPTKMVQVEEGDFVLSGIDARNGAFGIVPKELDGAVISNDFWCLTVNSKFLSKELFLYLTKTAFFDHICKQASDGTTQRIRLQKDKFYNYEISLPPREEQPKLLSEISRADKHAKQLWTELDHQQTLLKQLRQAILQEAVQGKLTEQWRGAHSEVEPASALLERIQAEKARLVKEKRIRKQKPLPPVAEEEVPFDLPQGWVWCRLGDAGLFERGKSKA